MPQSVDCSVMRTPARTRMGRSSIPITPGSSSCRWLTTDSGPTPTRIGYAERLAEASMSLAEPHRPIRAGLVAGVILTAFSATACYAGGCGTRAIGKITVATLNRAPMVTLTANGHAVTLILDTGAERTVLTPGVAERIGAQRPSIEFQRRLRGMPAICQVMKSNCAALQPERSRYHGVASLWRQ